MKILILIFLVSAFSAYALETDNYLVWDKTLPDSGDEINEFFHSRIEEALASAKDDLSCEQVTLVIGKSFRTRGSTRKLYENWTVNNLQGKIFPETSFYLDESIYRNTYRRYLGKSGLSPNIQVNGIYFGVDKISHFASTGRRYFQEYLKKIKKGYSSEQAEKSVIRFGLLNETTILGLWPTGVFSYGDMEANYQGFRFYKSLCLNSQDTYLQKANGRWKLVKNPDIRKYASPYWDETFNHSYRSRGMWTISARAIKENYCSMRDTQLVQERFSYYSEIASRSASMAYIEHLQARRSRLAPVPQSIEKLCH